MTTSDHGRPPPRKAPSLDKEFLQFLTRKSSWLGILKVGLYFASIVFLVWLHFAYASALLTGFIVVAMGCLFAHGLELQHEALHQNLFRGPFLNRAIGTVLGLPMLVSYTHYKSYHFHHHIAVGTQDDEEIVDYSMDSLRNPMKLIARAWNVTRIPRFFLVLAGMLRGHYPPRVKRNNRKPLLREYVLMAAIFAAMALVALIFRSWAPVILWFAPWLLVAEPMHFVIEVPEHLGCDRRTSSILRNTRSYRTSFLWGYVANHNNYHIEHHLWPAVASHRLHHLHRHVIEADGHCSDGFWRALGEVNQAARSSGQF